MLLLGLNTQQLDIRTGGIDPPAQPQRHRRLFGRQVGAAFYAIAGSQIAFGLHLQVLKTQGRRQGAAGLEVAAGQAQLGRQMLGQGLHLALQACVEVAAAVGIELKTALQLPADLQRHLPGLAVHFGQLHATAQGQRPVALRCQAAAQIQTQVISAQGQLLQFDTAFVPAGD